MVVKKSILKVVKVGKLIVAVWKAGVAYHLLKGEHLCAFFDELFFCLSAK